MVPDWGIVAFRLSLLSRPKLDNAPTLWLTLYAPIFLPGGCPNSLIMLENEIWPEL